MKPEHYKPIKGKKPKRKSETSKKIRRLAMAPPITSPQLREAYSTKIEWAKNLLPELKKEAEAPKEKEEPK